jgi:hypothetical protein
MNEKKLIDTLWEDAHFMQQYETLNESDKQIVKSFAEDLTVKIEAMLTGFQKYANNPESYSQIENELKSILMSGNK